MLGKGNWAILLYLPSETMRKSSQSLKLLLIVLLVIVGRTSQAKPRPGFGFGAYMGMTLEEVAATYRKTQDARAWTAQTPVRSNGHATQLIFWFYSYASKNSMSFMLRDGFVVAVTSTEADESGINFRFTETLLNRHLVALNDHQWFDKASQSEWDLTSEKGVCTLFVYKRGVFKK